MVSYFETDEMFFKSYRRACHLSCSFVFFETIFELKSQRYQFSKNKNNKQIKKLKQNCIFDQNEKLWILALKNIFHRQLKSNVRERASACWCLNVITIS